MTVRLFSSAVVFTLVGAGLPLSVGAQVRNFTAPSKSPQADADIPRDFLPPAGMCRIWLDNVPPAQQPAPTDCATAIRRKPQKARVIFGQSAPRKDEPVKDTTKPKKP